MRKVIWCSCLTGAVVAASGFCSAWYGYSHPQTLVGRSAALGLQISMRCNPLVNGATVAFDMAKWSQHSDEPVAQADIEDSEFDPELPATGNLNGLEMHNCGELAEAPVPAIVIDDDDLDRLPGFIVSSREPPLAGNGDCAGPADVTVYHPTPKRLMPRCQEDDQTVAEFPCPVDGDEECPAPSWFSLCWQSLQNCWNGSDDSTVADKGWFSSWFGYFSSPSMLDLQGDEELSEPPMNGDDDPSEDKEEPYHSYHQSDCPYSGACPYTGRMPSYDPPAPVTKPAESTEQSEREKIEPKKGSKKEIKLPAWWGDAEDSENKPIPHPEVDTMEFRPSDHGWDDYGPPSQL